MRKKARDIEVGDQIVVTTMGGQELLEVTKVEWTKNKVTLTMEWGFHIPISTPEVDTFPPFYEFEVEG